MDQQFNSGECEMLAWLMGSVQNSRFGFTGQSPTPTAWPRLPFSPVQRLSWTDWPATSTASTS